MLFTKIWPFYVPSTLLPHFYPYHLSCLLASVFLSGLTWILWVNSPLLGLYLRRELVFGCFKSSYGLYHTSFTWILCFPSLLPRSSVINLPTLLRLAYWALYVEEGLCFRGEYLLTFQILEFLQVFLLYLHFLLGTYIPHIAYCSCCLSILT